MFVAYNTALLSCGYAVVTTPSAPITPDPLLSFNISNTTAAAAQYSFNSAAVNPSSFQVFASPPYSAGKM